MLTLQAVVDNKSNTFKPYRLFFAVKYACACFFLYYSLYFSLFCVTLCTSYSCYVYMCSSSALPMCMPFLDCDIVSGATTSVLQELLSRPDSKHAHLNFLLHDMPFQSTLSNHFDCTSIQFEQVCKKSLGKKLLARMFSFGMTVSSEDVAHAVKLLPDKNAATLDVIAAHCEGPTHESLSLAYVEAEQLNKPQLLDCLVKRGAARPETPQVSCINMVFGVGSAVKAATEYPCTLGVL